MRAPPLPRLTWPVRRQAAVPIGEIEELAIRCAVDLLELIVVAGVVRRVYIARALERPEAKELCRYRTNRAERMAKRDLVQRAVALLLLQWQLLPLLDGTSEGFADEHVALLGWIFAEPLRIGGSERGDHDRSAGERIEQLYMHRRKLSQEERSLQFALPVGV